MDNGAGDLNDHHGRGGHRSKKKCLVVFILGGMTYSEMRSINKLGEALDMNILLGSTDLITSEKFIHDLGGLRGYLTPDQEAHFALEIANI